METREQATLLSDIEAFAGVAFAAIAADKQIKDIELIYLQTIFSRMRLFKGWTVGQYKSLFDKLRSIQEKQGFEAFLDMSVQALPPKLYQTAFAISVDLVLADGIVTKEEKDFLYDLQRRLGIKLDLATKIIEVITIKNKG
jgi:hypothetical protein